MNSSKITDIVSLDTKTKRCSTCKEHLLVSLFSKNRSTEDGYQNVCKACKAPLNKKWWDKHHNSAHSKAVDCDRVKSATLIKTMKK